MSIDKGAGVMRTKISGFVVTVLMVMAVGGLTAPPTFATDYFAKYLNTIELDHTCGAVPPSGPRHGTVVFKRTATSMSATVYLRSASHNTEYSAGLRRRLVGGTCAKTALRLFMTDSNGNGTVQLGPDQRKGVQAFWVDVLGPSSQGFETAEVPAFGF